MATAPREGAVRVELYVRGELPPPARDQAADAYQRLSELADEDALEAVDRTEWPKRTPVDACADGLRDLYLDFSSWASEADVRLTPFFGTRECYSPAHGEHRDWLVLPALCLAVYRDGELSAVYPHAAETETYTVQDGLEALERDGTRRAGHSVATAD